MRYFFSVDLGTMRDYTAISLLERVPKVMGKNKLPGTPEYAQEKPKYTAVYKLRYLERLPLGLDYPTIVNKIKGMMSHEKLQRQTALTVDATGVGLGIFHMMQHAGMAPIGITITPGANVTRSPNGFNVPKGELVSALNLVFQARRIKVPAGLKLKPEFMKELERFQVKFKNNFTTYEAAQESVHDDLVLSVAMAVWYAEHTEGSVIHGFGSATSNATALKNPLKELL